MHGLEGIVFIVLATFAIVQTMRCSLFKEELDVEKRWTKMRDED